tara:strand:+ start:593 stop:3886 length:3294 start_codon:yes stop_codon:yes gene_type:complete
LLTIYRSNKAEWLAEVLGHELRLKPPDLTEEVNIIVSTWPTSRWLGERISLITNINGLIKFPFPGAYLKLLVRNTIGVDPKEKDPWEKQQLIWYVLELLPDLIQREEASVIKLWLKKSNQKNETINLNLWELANNIVEIFDDYILYRPNLIRQWLSEESNKKLKERSYDKNYLWQKTLFNLLYKKINKEPFCIQAYKAIKILSHSNNSIQNVPRNLYIFGLSNLAPLQIDLVQALSKVIEIKLFLISPCNDLWQRCEARRLQFTNTWNTPPDKQWLLESPRLEAFLGRMGAEFQQLLEGSGEYQLGKKKEEDLFSLTANMAKNKGNKPSLLEQLQQELLSTEIESSLKKENSDKSLLFIKSQGKYRQVELIRDQILELLAKNKSLQPRDIIIMTPQIKRYTPIFSSVFNNLDHSITVLPWTITDRSQEDKIGLIHFVLNLLEISADRLTASNLDILLSNPALQKQQNISSEEVFKIINNLQSAGFTWGLDSSERHGDLAHSLCWCLERFLLGIVLPSDHIDDKGDISPYSVGITNTELIKSWSVLSKICNYIEAIRCEYSSKDWIALLNSMVEDIFGDGGEWIWEAQLLLNILNTWGETTKDCDLKIDCLVVKDILKKGIGSTKGKFGHRTGKITISALEPMRAIPHKVIIIMGLESKTFPRTDNRRSFNLLERKREIGDNNQYDKDRYSLLEALISARENLIIAWNAKDEKTGETIEPPSPIQQWLNYLKIKLEPNSFKNIIIDAPANPLDHLNFIKTEKTQILSCDKKFLKARKWIDKLIPKKNLSLALPIKWEYPKERREVAISYEKTKEWLINPQITWLNENEIQSKESSNLIEDNDFLELSELERFKLIKHRLENNDLCNDYDIEDKKNYWNENYSGTGIFPPKSSGLIEQELLEERWESLIKTINNIGTITKRSVNIGDRESELYFGGENLIQIEIGRFKYKTLMNAWLNHLNLSANSEFNSKTLIITRSNNTSNKNNFKITKELLPIKEKEARIAYKSLEELAQLGRENCWPIPPESGLAYALATKESIEKMHKKFDKIWEGDFHTSGEKENLAMKLCFGRECKSSDFFNEKNFHEILMSLYAPILEKLN